MAKPKILLISLVQNDYRSLGLISLFSLFDHKGYEANLLFLPKEQEYNYEFIKQYLLSSGFDIVGISVWTAMLGFAGKINSDIRKILPESHIVWGGIHPTLMPEECLDFADSVCIGEGETTMLHLVEHIASKSDISQIAGIGTKNIDGSYRVNEPAPLVQNLDTIPYNRFDWNKFYIQDKLGTRNFTEKEYIAYSKYNGEDYSLMATRSCPYSCAYCCNSFINSLYEKGTPVRKRSVDNVIEEIKNAQKLIPKIKFINFIDDQFLTSRKWLKEFVQKYKKEISLPFCARLVPGSFNDKELKLLKDAGLRFVQSGIQSGSERTHKMIFQRKFNRNQIIETSKIYQSNDIHPFYDVIMQNDLEDDSDRDKTIQLLLELKKPFSFNFYALAQFPRTKLESIYKARGIKPKVDAYKGEEMFCVDDDFYYQLASIIPFTPNFISRFIFKFAKLGVIKILLKGYFKITINRQKKRLSAQEIER